METLKKIIVQHLKSTKYTFIIEGKTYTSQQLAEEVEKETPIGKRFLEIALKGTIERYSKAT